MYAQGINHVSESALERAERFARMIAVHLEQNNFDGARAVIVSAEREYRESLAKPTPFSVYEIGLPEQVSNVLDRSGYLLVEQLARATVKELRRIPMLRDVRLGQIDAALVALGYESIFNRMAFERQEPALDLASMPIRTGRFPEVIRGLLDRKRWSQSQLALKLNVTEQAVYKAIGPCGSIRPRMGTIARYARALGVEPRALRKAILPG